MSPLRSNRARRGSSAIEAAMVMPILLTLFGGTVDSAMYLYQRSVVADAAQAGARKGAVAEDVDAISADATAAAQARLAEGGVPLTGSTVTATKSTGSTTMITVVVTAPFSSFTNLLPMPSSLSATATSHFENTSAS